MSEFEVDHARRIGFMPDALKHYARGTRLYNDSLLYASAQAFRRASHVATAIGAEDLEDKALFWLGASLHATGKLQEALAAWAPIINHLPDRPLNTDRYRALTRYVLVAVDLPLPLEHIEAAFQEVDTHIRTSPGDGGGLRSRMLHARARLALNRGDAVAALDLAQEALARGLREATSYSTSTYFRTVVRVCLAANELDLIPGYLLDWEAAFDCYPSTKRLLLAAGRTDYLRRVGEDREALEAIGPLRAQIPICEDIGFRTEAGSALCRALAATGAWEQARDVLACLARGRHSPVGEVRFQTRMMIAEWCRWRAENAGGADAEKARRALASVQREAARLDSLLQCSRHSQAVVG